MGKRKYQDKSSNMNSTGIKLVKLASLMSHLETGGNIKLPNDNISSEIYDKIKRWWVNLDIHQHDNLSNTYDMNFYITTEIKYIIKLISWAYSLGRNSKNKNSLNLQDIPNEDEDYQDNLNELGEALNPNFENIEIYNTLSIDLDNLKVENNVYHLPNDTKIYLSENDFSNLFYWWIDILYTNKLKKKLPLPWVKEYKDFERPSFEDFQLVLIFYLIDFCYYSGIETKKQNKNGVSILLEILNSQRDFTTINEDEFSDTFLNEDDLSDYEELSTNNIKKNGITQFPLKKRLKFNREILV